ncbi:reverse transcriptase [Penicillium frequentans]|uniref:Reverse transcriptase n=1 Tax=Penicillium frequentans TaxID=3151616 RepID=A0AAD6CZZ9_9EURO|nr:reverse transcriptase [Penicillium glabrum]
MLNATLRILQANCWKSRDKVMMHLFGEEEVQRMEILAIQEPEVYGFGDAGSLMMTYSQALSGNFHVLLRPTLVEDGEDGKPRVCLYVNKKIDPKTWSVRHHSRDLSTLTVRTALGAVDIHNIYVPSKVGVAPTDRARVGEATRESLTVLRTALHRGHLGRQVVVGDFNLHHPLWSTCRQATATMDSSCWSLSAAENCRLLTRLHQKAEVWARRHASIFAPAKYGLMHMWKKGVGARKPNTPTDIPLMLNGVGIQPTSSLRYLGIELDENLTGRAQVDRCRKKAAALVAALRSIAGMTWGVNTLNLRRMWTAVLLPQIAFACSAWRTEGAYGMKGVEETARRAMESIQYQALYKIAGAFRTTSRSALEICLFVPPVSITMQRLSEETCLRLHATPIESTPRTTAVHGTAMPTAHHALISPLQRLELHLRRKGIDVARIERIRPFAVAPWWEPPETHIAPTKEQAIQEHHRVIRATNGPNLAIGYTDGSGTTHGVGASATTSRGDAITVLGTLETHTVYAAELEGIRLALQLFLRGDGQRNTAIRACAHLQRSSGQHTVREISCLVEALRGIGCHVRIRWIPGHVGVAGNERADRLANDAANVPTTASPLMVLLSGCRMKLRRIAFEHWTQEWVDGEHGAYARLLFPVPTKDIFELHETLPRAASSALIQMQTGKIGLPGYLNTIPRWREEQLEANPLRDPARCSCDIGNQDTQHVLLTCPCFTDLRLRVLGPPHARTRLTWKDWLTKPASAVKATTFILKTRLLGQFRALPNTFQASRTGSR